MAIIKKTITSLARMWTFIYCWWAYVKQSSSWKPVWQFLQKLNINLSFIQPSNPILRYLFKRNENSCPHQALYVNARSNIIQNSPKAQNNPSVHQLVNGWTKCVSFVEVYSAMERQECLKTLDKLSQKTVTLSARSEAKTACCIISFVWNVLQRHSDRNRMQISG